MFGNMLHGMLTPSAPPSLAAQRSVLLDGVNEVVNLGAVSSILSASPTAYSISFWVKAAVTVAQWDGLISSNSNASWNDGIMIYDYGSNWAHGVNHYNDNTAKGTITAAQKLNWNHVLATYESGTTNGVTLYINGAVAAILDTYTGAVTATGNNLLVGFITGSASYHINAYFCQIAVWDVALSSSDATTLYNSGAIKEANQVQSGNLVGWWRVDADDDPTTTGGIKDHAGTNDASGVNLESGDLTTTVP